MENIGIAYFTNPALENGLEKNRLVGLQTEQQILNFYNG